MGMLLFIALFVVLPVFIFLQLWHEHPDARDWLCLFCILGISLFTLSVWNEWPEIWAAIQTGDFPELYDGWSDDWDYDWGQ